MTQADKGTDFDGKMGEGESGNGKLGKDEQGNGESGPRATCGRGVSNLKVCFINREGKRGWRKGKGFVCGGLGDGGGGGCAGGNITDKSYKTQFLKIENKLKRIRTWSHLLEVEAIRAVGTLSPQMPDQT